MLECSSGTNWLTISPLAALTLDRSRQYDGQVTSLNRHLSSIRKTFETIGTETVARKSGTSLRAIQTRAAMKSDADPQRTILKTEQSLDPRQTESSQPR